MIEELALRARKAAGKEAAITVCEALGIPRREEHLQQILRSFEAELRWATQLPDPSVPQAPEEEVGPAGSASSGAAGPAAGGDNTEPEVAPTAGAPAPPPPPDFEEVTADEARRRQRRVGGKIYCCTTPPAARGVWLGRWIAMLAAYPDLVGQQCRSVDEGIRSLSRDVNPIRIRLAP